MSVDAGWLLGVITALATAISALAGYIAKMHRDAYVKLEKDTADRLAEKDRRIAQLETDGRLKDDKIEDLRDENSKNLGTLRKMEGRVEEAARIAAAAAKADAARAERGRG